MRSDWAAESFAFADGVNPRDLPCRLFVKTKAWCRASTELEPMLVSPSGRLHTTTTGPSILLQSPPRATRSITYAAAQQRSMPFATLMGNSIVKQDNSDRGLQVRSLLPAENSLTSSVASKQSRLYAYICAGCLRVLQHCRGHRYPKDLRGVRLLLTATS